MTETNSRKGHLRISGAGTGFGHLDLGPSILFRVSNFVLRIYRAKGERLPYGVLPQRPCPQGPDSLLLGLNDRMSGLRGGFQSGS